MKIKTFLIVLSSFFLALFFGVFIFLQYNKEEKLSWANLGEPSTSKNSPGKELFFTEAECAKSYGVIVFSDTITYSSSPYFLENSDTICGTSGDLLGIYDIDVLGAYCCRY